MTENTRQEEKVEVADTIYLAALKDILETGETRQTRNGNTISKFGIKLDFDVSESFPLLTTKKVFWKGVVQELLWFLQAETNSKILEDEDVNIWKGNSSREYLDSVGLNNLEEGDCGPIYGFQWRHFNAPYDQWWGDYEGQGIDQLQEIIDQIQTNPFSRRLFMSAWNPCQIKEMCLPPCHVSYQFYVSNDSKELSCIMYQRSGDMFLGIPFNIASTTLLLYIIAKMTDTKPGKVSIVIGDAHIYEDHIDQVKVQLERIPYPLPQVNICEKREKIEDYIPEDIELINYVSHPTIKAKML